MAGSTAGDPSPGRSLAPRRAFWITVAAFVVIMLGTTLPTPLYAFYQERLGLSALMSAIVFAVYAGGVLVALLLLGRLSEAVGYRRSLLPGVGFALLSALAFLLAHGTVLLLVARFLSGLSAGVFTGTATAALLAFAGDGAERRAGLVATVANMAGLGGGPLLAGVLAQFAPGPLVTPFVVHAVLLGCVGIGVCLLPDDKRASGRGRPRLALPMVPRTLRADFFAVALVGFAGFAVLGLFTSVAPVFLRDIAHRPGPALAGVVAGAVFAASALGQIFLPRVLGGWALPFAGGMLLVAMGALALALTSGSLAALVTSAVLAGLGQGVCLRVGVGALAAAAPPALRASVISAFFVAAYLGTSVPVVGLGLAADVAGLRSAGLGFALFVAVLAVIALTVQSLRSSGERRRRR
ncbi:MFS transporter [Streptomyces sp. NPDC058867]|uniref:MFS transporter n=1 Tax=unclassified Streptomyces TaxID=2593676 RepID=UPI003683B7DC